MKKRYLLPFVGLLAACTPPTWNTHKPAVPAARVVTAKPSVPQCPKRNTVWTVYPGATKLTCRLRPGQHWNVEFLDNVPYDSVNAVNSVFGCMTSINRTKTASDGSVLWIGWHCGENG